VTLYTRSGVDWTARFPAIAAEVARLPAGKLVIDGEVISADAEGRPSFFRTPGRPQAAAA
jgi:bifunctional non-homologous end joining protein LigD